MPLPFSQRILWTELNDLNHFPLFLKTPYIDCLGFVLRVAGFYRQLGPLLSDISEKIAAEHIQDFGSGSASHIRLMIKKWPRHVVRPEIILTDICPRPANFIEMSENFSNIRPIFASVDMTQASLPPHTVATLFSCFHHLSHEQAHLAIENMAAQAEAVVIFEPFERSFYYLLKHFMLAFPSVLLGMFTPLLQRFSWSSLFFCTLIPIAPICVQIDGLISVLRSYRYAEIQALMSAAGLETEIRGRAVVGFKRNHKAATQSMAA